jgi:hypothetical protein
MTSPLHAFALRRGQAAHILDTLASAVATAGPEVARFVAPLRAGASRTRDGRFVVLLVGCFSSGKSSVLNALLGQPVLPVKVNPCTAILTELRHGEAPSVQVLHRHGVVEDLEPVEFLRRYQLLTPDATGDELDRFAGVERAIVRWPLPILADGVALVDTPGLDDDPARTARTMRSLPDADAVIFVLSATRFLTDLERTTLRRDLLPLGLTNLFFPTTMADLLDSLSDRPDEERAAIRERATEILGPLSADEGGDRLDERFFLLDARGALRARWIDGARRDPPDVDALARSGFPPFVRALERFLVDERGRAQLQRGLGLAERALDGVERQAALDRATAEATLDELRERLARAGPQLEALAQVAARVAETCDAFVAREATRTWQGLRAALAEAERDLPEAMDRMDLGAVAGLDLLTPGGRARAQRAIQERVEAWLDERMREWQAALASRLRSSLNDLRAELAAEATVFDGLTREILTDFAGGAVRVPVTELLGDEPDPLERWFSVALGAVLLSPGTMAAGWAQGYEGALKGAASRVALRVAILAIGVLVGPVGWAGLLLYAIGDAALLVLTGGGQLRRLRRQVAENLQGRLVGQADAARGDVERAVHENLTPIRDALVGAARSEADDLARALDDLVAARERAAADASARAAAFDAATRELRAGVERLRDVIGPDPARTPKRVMTFGPGEIPAALLRSHDLRDGTWALLTATAGAVVFVDGDGRRTPLTVGRPHLVPPIAPHHLEIDDEAAIELRLFEGRPAAALIDP